MTVYGLQVEVSVGGDNAGEGALQRLSVAFERGGAEIDNFGKWVFPKLAPVFEAALTEQFNARGGGPMSGAWTVLSDAYGDWKAIEHPGVPLLELTGDLRAALTTSASPLAYREWSASEFAFGTSGLEYASFHQTGTGDKQGKWKKAGSDTGRVKGGGMPARPLFDFGPAFERGLQRAAGSGLRDAIKATSNGMLDLEGEP